MNISKNGIALIKEFENCKLKAYLCPAKKWTIGWGSITINGRAVVKGDSITQAEADLLLNKEIKEKVDAVNILVSKVALSQHQFDALVSFAYNLGSGALKTSTLLKKVLINPNDKTIKDEFIRWRNKGTAFEKGLLRRRLSEAYLYFNGLIKFEFDQEIAAIMDK